MTEMTTDMVRQLRQKCLQDELAALSAEQEAGLVSDATAETVRLQLVDLANGERIVSRFLPMETVDPEAAERSAAAVADAGMAPPFPVAGCELVADQVFSAGEAFVCATGIVAFARLGNASLVAMPDPSNRRIRDEVVKLLGECRFFRCRADEAQTFVDRAGDERRKGGVA